MSKRQHQRQLQRTRARRQADKFDRRRRRARWTAITAVVALALSVFAAALVSLMQDDPAPRVDDPASQGDDPQARESPCPPVDEGDVPDVDAQQYDEPPPMEIDPEATYVATMDTTCGDIEVELDAAGAPTATNSFVFLAREGFYEGVGFHRVIEGFVIQGGDPEGTGAGGPGYTFEDELGPAEEAHAQVREQLLVELEEQGQLAPEGEIEPEEVPGGYPRGVLAMANSGPDTNGSQFFITHGDPTGLTPDYTIFGEVVEGMDVVDDIARSATEGERAVDPVRIRSIDVEER